MSSPSTLPSDAAAQAYATRLAAARAALARLDHRGAWLAHGRTLTFIAAAGLGILRLLHRFSEHAGWMALGFALAYAALAWVHGAVLRQEGRERVRVELNERGLARLNGTWRSFPSLGEAYLQPDHLYAPDLDLFGKASLFQLLDETATRSGEATLAAWLNQGAPADEVRERQGAVRELQDRLDFRQALVVESRAGGREKADPARLITWAEQGPTLDPVRWARPLPFVLPPLTLLLYVLGRMGTLPGWSFYLGLLVLVGVVALTRRPLGELFDGLSMGESGLVRLEQAFAQVEAAPFQHPALRRRAAGFGEDTARVSQKLASLGSTYAFAELRRNQLHPLLNLLTLWDLVFLFRLDDWRRVHGPQVRAWFQALAELEALCCLAGFAHDRPSYPMPVLADGVTFQAQGLAHPLLDAPVRNDVALDGPGRVLLVTGSNMSGKTTLLRSMGINTVLAMAGAPVAAEALTLSPLGVLTSMRVKDSLERGVSYFHAEVKRLKAVLDAAARAQGRILVLLDEILMGTNTRERQWASREVLRLLRETGALAAIATHDLTLATLEAESQGQVRNVHFVDLVEDGKMTFDYRLRDGVVRTTNALRVLRAAGIPVRDEG